MIEKPDRLYLTNCRLIDGLGGPAVPGAVIAIENGCVADVRQGEPDIEPGSAAIDLNGRTVLPGLIDCHIHLAHWGLNPGLHQDKRIMYMAAETVARLREAVESGFTAMRDCGGLDSGFRDAVNENVVVGPRLQVSVTILSPTNGTGDRTSTQGIEPYFLPGAPNPVCDGPTDVRRKVREIIRAGADFIKIATTGGASSRRVGPREPLFGPQEVEAIVDEAHAWGKRVICHALGGPGLRTAVDAGVDTIEHGCYLDSEIVRIMRDKGIWYVPTFAVYRNHIERGTEFSRSRAHALRDAHRRSLDMALEAGVQTALGSDAGGHDIDSGLELECLADAGLSPMEVLAIATRESARCLGWNETIGTLTRGMQADLIVVDGRPDEDITALRAPEAVQLTMIGGSVVHQAGALSQTGW